MRLLHSSIIRVSVAITLGITFLTVALCPPTIAGTASAPTHTLTAAQDDNAIRRSFTTELAPAHTSAPAYHAPTQTNSTQTPLTVTTIFRRIMIGALSFIALNLTVQLNDYRSAKRLINSHRKKALHHMILEEYSPSIQRALHDIKRTHPTTYTYLIDHQVPIYEVELDDTQRGQTFFIPLFGPCIFVHKDMGDLMIAGTVVHETEHVTQHPAPGNPIMHIMFEHRYAFNTIEMEQEALDAEGLYTEKVDIQYSDFYRAVKDREIGRFIMFYLLSIGMMFIDKLARYLRAMAKKMKASLANETGIIDTPPSYAPAEETAEPYMPKGFRWLHDFNTWIDRATRGSDTNAPQTDTAFYRAA